VCLAAENQAGRLYRYRTEGRSRICPPGDRSLSIGETSGPRNFTGCIVRGLLALAPREITQAALEAGERTPGVGAWLRSKESETPPDNLPGYPPAQAGHSEPGLSSCSNPQTSGIDSERSRRGGLEGTLSAPRSIYQSLVIRLQKTHGLWEIGGGQRIARHIVRIPFRKRGREREVGSASELFCAQSTSRRQS